MFDTAERSSPPAAALRQPDPQLLVAELKGDWTGDASLPRVELLCAGLEVPAGAQIRFETESVSAWDSRLVTWVLRFTGVLEEQGVDVDYRGLPAGVKRLIDLAGKVPERRGAHQDIDAKGLFTRIGEASYDFFDQSRRLMTFIGEVAVAFYRLFTGRARLRRSDLFLFVQEAGAEALPIVGLISVLVGMILAFIGSLQLSMFGAQIYVANLVGIAMVREMGAMMAAIIMAGRTGASFSAQLGTMQVNQEIDAFRTLGIPPVEFLVLPRIIALTLMMPLLCIYADLVGIAGGLLVGVTLFDISFFQYLEQTRSAIDLADVAVGVGKSLVFGVLVAVAGCMHGIHCGRSASAVGRAVTSAVVMSIVAVVVADAVMTLITNALGI